MNYSCFKLDYIYFHKFSRVLMQKNINDGREVVFLDHNSWINDGEYGISEKGSDWTRIYIHTEIYSLKFLP